MGPQPLSTVPVSPNEAYFLAYVLHKSRTHYDTGSKKKKKKTMMKKRNRYNTGKTESWTVSISLKGFFNMWVHALL